MENELHHQPATFEKIHATLDRITEKQEKSAVEIAEIRELQKETDCEIKKLAGLFTNQWGALMENLVESDLASLSQAQGITVQFTRTRIHGRRNGAHFEFDILAVNDAEEVVEVKTTLRAEDVAQFLEKLGRFTVYAPVSRGKKVYGAMAYLKADTSVQVHAERQGLFVIRATGNSSSIINAAGFVPRVFG